MTGLKRYMPMDPSRFVRLVTTGDPNQDPEYIRQVSCYEKFREWEMWFGRFTEQTKLCAWANAFGARIKGKHTIVGAWPFEVGAGTTKKEFEVLCAGGNTGVSGTWRFRGVMTELACGAWSRREVSWCVV
jgi:hypothetical protein